MKFFVLSPEKSVDREAELVNELFDMGLQLLHLRKPSFSENDYRGYVNEIRAPYRCRIVLHGYYHLMEELGLNGIHLNEAARNSPEVWEQIKFITPDQISTSFHSWNEIMENDFQYRYVFISPVFDSISKHGYKAGIKLDEVKNIRDEIKQSKGYCPEIIGLGGVGCDELKTLYQSGFDGGALLGSIWNSDNPVERFKEILDNVKRWSIG